MRDQEFSIEALSPGNVEEASSIFDAYRRFYGKPGDVPAALSFLSARLQERSSDCWVARAKTTGELVGLCQCYRTFSSVSMCGVLVLNDLFVNSDWRQCGVGRCLINHAVEHAQTIKAGFISLETAQDNHSAQKLYRSLGFEPESGFITMTKTI